MSKVIELELSVPTRMSDINLQQYQKYVNVVSKIEEQTEESNNFINLKALEIFCGLELKESYKLPMSGFSGIIGELSKAMSEDTPLVKRFWFRGSNGVEVEFGMIPNLQDISFGEYIDLDKYINDWPNMHKAMAVLFRPITSSKGDFYDIEEYEGSDKYSDYMLYMPLNVALGALVFFYRLGMKLSKYTMAYSLEEMNKEQRSKVESKFLERNGVGISQFMQSLEETSQSLTKLPKLHYTSA